MIHLDTNFLIRGLVHGAHEDTMLRRWLGTGEQLVMSTVAWAEFLCGPVTAKNTDLAARVVSERRLFSEEEARTAGELFNASGRRRGTFVDCMIAAAAIRAKAPLATDNPRDFKHFVAHGLRLIT